MRIPTQRILAADALGLGSHIIELELDDGTSVNIRVIKFELSSGEIEILITNVYGGVYTYQKKLRRMHQISKNRH